MSSDEREAALSRNLGFWSIEEQDVIRRSVVAIAGTGGDGGALAEQLARAGVGEIRLADPDRFEMENVNRQAFCNNDTVGRPKVDVVADGIQSINPALNIGVFADGVTLENIDAILDGADLIIDETEYTLHQVGVVIARAARRHNIPNVMAMNVGFGATVTSFAPYGQTFEQMLGIPEDMPLDEVVNVEVPLSRWLPYIPPYFDLSMYERVSSGEASAPSVASGVALAAGMAAVQVLLHLTRRVENRRPSPVVFPDIRVMDGMTGDGFTVTDPARSYEQSMARALVNNRDGKVPKVFY